MIHTRLKTANSRKVGGYSIRESLLRQGVSTTEGMKRHLAFIAGTLQGNPDFDVTTYRVDKTFPNNLPTMG